MVLEIVGMLLAVIILAVIINGVDDYCRQRKRVNMSFKEAMDLVELPVVTFYNGDKKLNFLLDTGSNISQINSSVLPLLDHKKVEEKNMDVTGIEGSKVNTEFCEMTITYKGQEFVGEFCIHDLDDAFAIVKEESGVQIHGILGSLFFQKYKYVFDFESFIAYSKK
nr:MAG: aspartyl protease [Bacteriophage sp.]